MLLDKCEGNQKYLLYFLSIPGKKKRHFVLQNILEWIKYIL